MPVRPGVLPRAFRLRLQAQLEGLPALLTEAGETALYRRPPSGKWSAHEHLAHLGRHHAVMLERLERILNERQPQLERYRAEDDPEWPEWAACSTREVLERLTTLRHELIAKVEALSPEELAREAQHPLFGWMAIPQWLDYFLLHEAHHLYQAVLRRHGG
jgi:hypothetical protein